MMDFSDYTTQNILDDMLTQVDESFDTREGSIISSALGPSAWYLEGVYLELAKVQQNAYASTAVGSFLDYIVEERHMTRKAATPAVRKGKFNIPVPEGSRFSTISGEGSLVFDSGELISASEDTWIYRMICETAGIEGNTYSGSLMPITVIEGLSIASLGEIITPGTDEETDDALRARYYASFETTNFGGNISAYREKILARADVGAVQVYPAWNGGGTVLCSVLGADLTPATQGVINSVQEEICPLDGAGAPSAFGLGFAPIGAAVTITTAQTVNIDISATVTNNLAYAGADNDLKTQIRNNLKAYIDSVNAGWDNALKLYTVEYPMTFYISRIIVAIASVQGVINVSDVKINGSEQDLQLMETAQLQQIARLGEVVLT